MEFRRAGPLVNLVLCGSVCYRSCYSWACPRCSTGASGVSGRQIDLAVHRRHGLGNAVWLLVATLGLAALALQLEQVFVAIKWLGVVLILFIAWNLWSKNTDQPEAHAQRSASRGLLSGAMLTLGNPKAVVFFGAVLPHAFDLTALSVPEVVLITALGVGIDVTVQMAYLLMASRIKCAIRSPKAMKRLNRTSASVMTGCAGWMAIAR